MTRVHTECLISVKLNANPANYLARRQGRDSATQPPEGNIDPSPLSLGLHRGLHLKPRLRKCWPAAIHTGLHNLFYTAVLGYTRRPADS